MTKARTLAPLILFVITLLVASSIGLACIQVSSGTSPAMSVLPPQDLSMHGPLINSLLFQYEDEDTAFQNLVSGRIPAMESTLSLAQYTQAQENSSLYTNSTGNYDFDGIAFNFLQYPYNNTYFRQAIAELMNFAELQSNLGPVIQAGNQIYNPSLFPRYYNGNVRNPYSYNTTEAMALLEKVPGMSYDAHTGIWSINYNGFRESPFMPQIYYRFDDPEIRTPAEQLLAEDASSINLTLAATGITDSQVDAYIFGPASEAVISQGVMGSNYQTIKPPVFNWTYVDDGGDNWGMYTFGWIVNFNPTFTWAFFNSQMVGIDNFGNYYNFTMDYSTNILNFANSTHIAQEAATRVQQYYYQNLPYVVFGWENSLYAVNPTSSPGWTGFANIPSAGPSTESGLYYTALNVHPANKPNGGTFTEALEQVPSSLDPLYVVNWVWQEDVWQETYDSPLLTPPTGVLNGTLANEIASYKVAGDLTKPIGSGPGWYNPFDASEIKNGEIVTLNFWKNATWNDGIPLNAYDYNASLYLWNIQGNSPTDTPLSYESAPPSGLLATYIPPKNPDQIQLYINSTIIWNIYNINIPVLPWHLFQLFNASLIATYNSAIDLTQHYSSALNGYLNKQYQANPPEYLLYMPNLEIGSGPFVFQSWNTETNVINLTRNTNFYRSAWESFSKNVTEGNKYDFSTNIQLEFYNAGTKTIGKVPPGQTGYLPIKNATGTLSVLYPNGDLVATYRLINEGNGKYGASIKTGSLKPGMYELVTQANYSAFGLSRVWYSYNGVDIQAKGSPGGSLLNVFYGYFSNSGILSTNLVTTALNTQRLLTWGISSLPWTIEPT